MKFDFYFVKKIVSLCNLYSKIGHVPVGSCIIFRRNNEWRFVFTYNNENEHAENILLSLNFKIEAIFISLEPCPACFFLILERKIPFVFFGAFNNLYGPCGGKFHLLENITGVFRPEIFGGILEKECSYTIKQFFCKKRSCNF